MKSVKSTSTDSHAAQPPQRSSARRETQSGPAASQGGMDVAEVEARHAFAQAQAGHTAAFGTVVRIYQDRIYNAVYRMVNHADDAAEITQEAFTRGMEKIHSFRGEAGPYTWLFRIAMNAAVSRIRKGGKKKTTSLDAMVSGSGGWQTGYAGRTMADESPSPDDQAEMSEDHKAVVDALGKLDTEYRAILVMRDMEGFDYKQMADVLGLPMGTLKSRLFRARVAMRELLQEHFAERYRKSQADETK